MDCAQAEGLLDIYLDRELEPVRSLEIEAHLRACARCAQSRSAHEALRRSLKADALYFKAPGALQRRVQHSVRKAAQAETPRRWLSPSWFKVAAPLAAAALVVLLLVPQGPAPDELLTQEVVSGHIRSLMADHLADVPSTDE